MELRRFSGDIGVVSESKNNSFIQVSRRKSWGLVTATTSEACEYRKGPFTFNQMKLKDGIQCLESSERQISTAKKDMEELLFTERRKVLAQQQQLEEEQQQQLGVSSKRRYSTGNVFSDHLSMKTKKNGVGQGFGSENEIHKTKHEQSAKNPNEGDRKTSNEGAVPFGGHFIGWIQNKMERSKIKRKAKNDLKKAEKAMEKAEEMIINMEQELVDVEVNLEHRAIDLRRKSFSTFKRMGAIKKVSKDNGGFNDEDFGEPDDQDFGYGSMAMSMALTNTKESNKNNNANFVSSLATTRRATISGKLY